MGNVNIKVTSAFVHGHVMLEDAQPRKKQLLTSSGTSTESTITADNRDDVIIVETDTDVWVKIGDDATVTASAGNDHLLSAGQRQEWTKQPEGSKVAVIDK